VISGIEDVERLGGLKVQICMLKMARGGGGEKGVLKYQAMFIERPGGMGHDPSKEDGVERGNDCARLGPQSGEVTSHHS